MDLNLEYAAHQRAVMRADSAASHALREDELAGADVIARRIGRHQHGLGAAAACAWNSSRLAGN